MRRLPSLATLLLVSVAGQASAAVPALLTVQGRALQGGLPVDGAVAMTLRLYPAQSGGVPIWEEGQSVACDDGFFTAVLGSAQALDGSSLSTGDELWLGVAVGGGDELAPRLRVTSVPFALVAERSLVADDVHCLSCVAASEVAFGYAGAASAGGAALDLDCTLDCVETGEISNGAVTSAKLATGSVVSATIADGEVTRAKLAPCAAGQILRYGASGWLCSGALTVADNGDVTLTGHLAVRGGPSYTSAATLVEHSGTTVFTHNLGYVPWCTWSQSEYRNVVTISAISTTTITLRGWSPNAGTDTNVTLRCW